jgi:hypothetical protein
MKNLFISTLSILAFILFVSNAYAFDKSTKTFDYKDFTEVEVSSGMHLTVTQSESYSIEVTADEDTFEHLRVEKSGSALKFYFKKNFFFDW